MTKKTVLYRIWFRDYSGFNQPAVVIRYSDNTARVLRPGDKGYEYNKRKALSQ